MKKILFLIVLLAAQSSALCQMNGIAFEAPSSEIGIEEFENMVGINANWVCLMPYAYSKGDSPEIRFNQSKYQWWGERYEGTQTCIRNAKKSGLKIMLKPHLWISHGQFTGDLTFEQEEDWNIWERDYTKYVLTYAKLAEEENVELFCIGTELKSWFLERPEYWDQLIKKIKTVYSGELTYAGNWDGYKLFPFWDQLDYIGVDAYFPLSTKKDASIEEINQSWMQWKEEMRLLSTHYQKKIILTEYGYRNIETTTSKPWESYTDVKISDIAQVNAYESLYQSLWGEDWLGGGFMWKWVCEAHLSRKKSTSYSPQGKAAFKVLRDFYSR